MFGRRGTNDAAAAGEDKTITWWHNSNNGEGKAYYEKVADDFEAAHEGVTVEVSAMQHEDMLTKLDAAFQSGDAPDVYMERGGGELAGHVEAGLTRDLSELATDEISMIGGNIAGWQVDGKTYALPYSVGLAGFWYNKALFKEAGISNPPQTMDEWMDAVKKLKAEGIDPVSVGAEISGRPPTTGTTRYFVNAPKRYSTPRSRTWNLMTSASSRPAKMSKRSLMQSHLIPDSFPLRHSPAQPQPQAC